MMKKRLRYSGRDFNLQEIKAIKSLIEDHPAEKRAGLSRRVCKMLGWLRHDGHLKEMSCRVAMLRMQDDGWIELPPPSKGNQNGKPYRRTYLHFNPEPPRCILSLPKLTNLHLELVTHRKQSQLWNEAIDRYHYLGYKPLPGAQLRYLVKNHDQVLAFFGFGASAWHVAPRDQFIGWTSTQREHHRHLVINNARFLILPWITCENLASKLLSMVAKRLPGDWMDRYSYRPVLMETFVETPRFIGTCYKAANWQYVGMTQGRGKLEKKHKAVLPKKSIWLYPLTRNFRQELCSE